MHYLGDRHYPDARTLLESAGASFAVADYRPRAVIFRQGDPCDCVLHITSGRVLLAVSTDDGREATSGLLEPGAFLGEDALAGHLMRRQTAIALTATQATVVGKAEMTRLLHEQPLITDQFIAHVLMRRARLEADLTDQLLHSGEQRLARALLLLAGRDESGRWRGALPHVSQALIAEMIGTSRPRVNLLLGRFKKRGLVSLEDGEVHVAPALLQVAREGLHPVSNGTVSPRARRYALRRGRSLRRTDDESRRQRRKV